MAKTNYMTFEPEKYVTAAQLNEQIRDNGNEIWQGEDTGDMDFYTSATTKDRLPIGTSGQILAVNSSGSAPIWKSLFTSRVGGSSTDWMDSGNTNYVIPSNYKIFVGSATLTASSSISASANITFPEAFTYKPLVITSAPNVVSGTFGTFRVTTTNIFTTGFGALMVFTDTTSATFRLHWLAIGV